MAIIASLFSSLPSTPPPSEPQSNSSPPSPPIPIPKYPPSLKSQRRNPQNAPAKPEKSQPNPALKAVHRRSNYYRPVKDGVIAAEDDDRAVVVGPSGVSYLLPGAPFEFQYSYSETPKAKPVAIREPAFLPFAPPTMPRPWTGKAPLKSAKEKKRNRKLPLLEPFNPPPEAAAQDGAKVFELPRAFPYGRYPQAGRSREEILGEPLKKWEISMMVKPLVKDNRQVNLGRDGLTHNMLELVHSHWRRNPVCKVRCKGVPTVDMENICRAIEEKTGGKIIYRAGGSVYVFCGRNYRYANRPQYPVMLWKPAAPVYPKLIQEAPGGLTKEEADAMRVKGKKLLPICKLAKNGVYITLVKEVRQAFEGSPLVKIDCKGMHATDYKKLGAKLMELVPCVLLSFDDEQILMWRGSEWKSMYRIDSLPSTPAYEADTSGKAIGDSENADSKTANPSPKMMLLWKRAIEANKAIVLDEINLGPDDLLKKVEEFEGVSQATEHSYPALILPGEAGISGSMDESHEDFSDEAEISSDYDNDDLVDDYSDEEDDDDLYNDNDSSLPMGSLPIDSVIAKKLNRQ